MFAEFRYLDGAEAGETRVVPNDFATLGRHPNSDVPFDPETALEVSVRHAAVFKQGGGFLIRDLGSSNGTFLNGKRVRGDRPLESGDVLQLGPTGPRLEFLIAAALPVTARSSKPHSTPVPVPEAEMIPPPVVPERPRTEERVAALVERRTARWRWLAAGGVIIAVLAGGFFGWQSYRLRQETEQERAALLARVDMLLARLERTKSLVPLLDSTLKQARSDIGSLRQSVAAGSLSSRQLDTLAISLTEQGKRQEPVIQAAAFDPVAATSAGGKAVTVVVAEFRGGHVLSGSGFAIRTHGDTAWIATNRHLIEDSSGARPTELAVVFNGTGQAFRASVAQVHDSADLALLVTRIRGGVPVVRSIGDQASAGEPVAMLGFPFGLDSLGDWRAKGAGATTSIGTITAVGADHLEVDGYGTHGSSGSPVFGPTGDVIGVVFGGITGGERRVLAVPGRILKAFLDAPPKRSLRR